MAHGIKNIDHARDLLLRSPIESALAAGNAEELKRLSAVYGFWQVLEIICDDSVLALGTDQTVVMNTFAAVDGSDLLGKSHPENDALKRFLGRSLSEAKWKQLDADTGKAVATAIGLGLDANAIRSCLVRLGSVKGDQKSELDSADWCAGLEVIASAIAEADSPEEYTGCVKLSATEQITDPLVALAKANDAVRNRVVRLLSLTGDVPSYVSILLPQPNAEWEEVNSQALGTLVAIPGINLSIQAILERLQERFRFDAEFKPPEVQRFVDILRKLEIYHGDAARVCIQTLVKEGLLFRRIHNFQKSMSSVMGAVLLRWAIRYHHFSQPPQTPANASAGFELAKQTANAVEGESAAVSHFADYCCQHRAEGLFEWAVWQADPLEDFVVAVVTRLRKANVFGAVCSAKTFVQYFAQFQNLCGKEDMPALDNLCAELLSDEVFTRSLTEVQFDDKQLKGITYLVRQNATSRSEEFAVGVKKYLLERTADQWKESLSSTASSTARSGSPG